jgi:hypothetical protein
MCRSATGAHLNAPRRATTRFLSPSEWLNACSRTASMNDEILIRLSEGEFSFIYSVLRRSELIESAIVNPIGPPVTVSPAEYYGGSEAS